MFNIFGKAAPPTETMKKLLEESRYTQDRLLLDRQEAILFFEYGEMMRGMPRHRNFGEFVSEGYTDQLFFHYVHRDGENTMPIITGMAVPRASKTQVKGELYLVDGNSISSIDIYRRNGVMFTRKQVKVYRPDGQPYFAFVYVACVEFWQTKLQWDSNFFKGREGRSFVPAKQKQQRSCFSTTNYSEFTRDNYTRDVRRSYIHFTNPNLKEDAK